MAVNVSVIEVPAANADDRFLKSSDTCENQTMQMPSFQKIAVPLGSLALIVLAYRNYGWQGVALAMGVLVMWLLLHFTRMLQILFMTSLLVYWLDRVRWYSLHTHVHTRTYTHAHQPTNP
jgi:Na+/H+-dicarboxylate symporter